VTGRCVKWTSGAMAGAYGARKCRYGSGRLDAFVVGAHHIGVTWPASDASTYFPAAYPCLQPASNPLATNDSEPDACPS
jgi:hypothetical protein